MKVIFKSITVTNWGPYHDNDNTIKFSKDPDKNVTYILGKNGSGKSLMFRAFHWCLFDDEMSGDFLDLSFDDLVNKNAKRQQRGVVSVLIDFDALEDDGVLTGYQVKRSVDFIVRDDVAQQVDSSIVYNVWQHGERTQTCTKRTEFERIINRYFPEGPRPFFFLDGEKLADLFTRRQMEKIKGFVESLSDIKLLDRVVGRLEEFETSKNEDLERIGRRSPPDEEAKAALENKDNAETRLKEKRKELERANEKFKHLGAAIDALEADLRQYNIVKKKLEEESKVEDKLKSANIRVNALKKELSAFAFQNGTIYRILIGSRVKEIETHLSKLRESGKLPPRIPRSLIDDSLNESKCLLCNRDLTPEIIASLDGSVLDAPTEREVVESQEIWEQLSMWKRDLSTEVKEIEECYKKLVLEKKSMDKLHSDLDDLRKVIPAGTDKESIIKKYEELSGLKDDEKSLSEKIRLIDGEIEQVTQDVDRYATKFKKATEKDDKYKALAKQIDNVRKMKRYAKMILTRRQDRLREYIEQRTSHWFMNLIWDPSHYREIRIDSNWEFTCVTDSGDVLRGQQLSSGQRHVLGIAFMSSLGEATSNLLPLTFDSPFGRVDEDPIEKIGKNLLSLMKGRQVILFVTTSEDRGIQKSVKNIIGKKYTINKISGQESRIMEGLCRDV
jgi:DNA sulfur modification protein DndD